MYQMIVLVGIMIRFITKTVGGTITEQFNYYQLLLLFLRQLLISLNSYSTGKFPIVYNDSTNYSYA